MITGFGPFELSACGRLQSGRDHSPPKACFYLRSPALGWFSQCYEYTVAKQNGAGAEWEQLYSYNGRGWANQCTDSRCLSAWWGGVSTRLVGSAVGSPGPKSTVAHLGLQLQP